MVLQCDDRPERPWTWPDPPAPGRVSPPEAVAGMKGAERDLNNTSRG